MEARIVRCDALDLGRYVGEEEKRRSGEGEERGLFLDLGLEVVHGIGLPTKSFRNL